MTQDMIMLGKAVVELGFSAAAMLLVIGLVIWHQYRIAPIMTALVYSSQRLIESADALSRDLDKHNGSVADVLPGVIQRSKDMHDTCREHGSQLDDISKRLARVEGALQK